MTKKFCDICGKDADHSWYQISMPFYHHPNHLVRKEMEEMGTKLRIVVTFNVDNYPAGGQHIPDLCQNCIMEFVNLLVTAEEK